MIILKFKIFFIFKGIQKFISTNKVKHERQNQKQIPSFKFKMNIIFIKFRYIINLITARHKEYDLEKANCAHNLKKKRKEKRIFTQEEKASKNLTFMIFAIVSLYIIGNAPNSFAFVFIQFFDLNSDLVNIILAISDLSLFTSQSCDFFVYYSFNRQFKKVFKKLLRL